MLPLHATLVTLTLVVAAVAGCAEAPEGDKAAASAKPTFAPKATADALTGSISGLVIDDESVPIIGAAVAIVEGNITARTDPDGRFTLNNLAPQTYEVIVDHFAFLGAARRVDVRAGEVSNLIFTLKGIPIDESYHFTIPRTFYILVDHDYVHFVMIAANANQSALYGLRCNPCWYVIHFERNTTQVLSEAMWNTGPGPVNTQAYNDFYKDWTDQAPYGTRACFVTLVNGGAANWTETCVKAIRPVTKLKVFINGGFTTVSVDQRIQTWHTFAYKGLLADNFTALPPR